MDDEIHPLDRDYSAIDQAAPRVPLTNEQKFRRLALYVFASGFVLAFIAAIALGINPGGGSVETFFSMVQRAGMFAILAGGCLLLVSYRTAAIKTRQRNSKGKKAALRTVTWKTLFLWNIAAFVIIAVLMNMIYWTAGSFLGYFLFNGLFTLLFAIMVTASIWHRGMVRAYAIGVLASLFISLFSSMFLMNLPGLRMRGGSSMIPFAVIATVQLSGLACAGYVSILESYRASTCKADRDDENALPS